MKRLEGETGGKFLPSEGVKDKIFIILSIPHAILGKIC